MQQLSAVALAIRQDGGDRGHGRGDQDPLVKKGREGQRPKQARHRQPGQASGGAQPLGEQQRGRNQEGQGAGGGTEPELQTLDQGQQAEGEQGLPGLQADPAVADQQHHHAGGGQGFAEVQQPGANQGPAVHQTEVIQHRVGLLADRFPLPGNQFPLAHLDGGDSLLGQELLQHPLTQGRVDAQVGAPLE